ncbi:hypothetical protein J2847_003748 [Azospirillum agricola]|uniref:hypothetical protein n=1 Tax=Azospirillum agricola TaxID=1720247 RepID=UPI001AE4A4B0|nr:hypothetical protein [Azospirillum agricola]MBP2230443.1 hypothetical protein [Azospirillum agricola]
MSTPSFSRRTLLRTAGIAGAGLPLGVADSRSFAQSAAPKGNLRMLKLAWSQGSSAPMTAACACRRQC